MEHVRFSLSADQFAVAEQFCEAIVPGSSHVGPAVYLDSIIADMPDDERSFFIDAFESMFVARSAGKSWNDISSEEYFPRLRLKAIEAYFCDFRKPGYTGPSAWDDIDYKSASWAARARQDWTFLKCYGGAK